MSERAGELAGGSGSIPVHVPSLEPVVSGRVESAHGVASVEGVEGVEVVDPCTDHRWSALVTSQGGLFQSPPWLRAIRDAFGVRPAAVVVCRDGRPVAGLAYAEVDDAVGRRLSTFPFSDYCDPVGTVSTERWALLTAAPLAAGIPYSLRARRHPVVDGDTRLRPGAAFRWHEVDLRGKEEQVWERLDAQARQNVRRAQRSGVTVTVGHDRAAVAELHRLHAELRRTKYGMLAQPVEYFDALAAQFAPDDLMVVTARLGDATDAVAAPDAPDAPGAVASVLLLRWADRAYYKFNASAPEAGPTRANDLVMWECIRAARSRWGSTALDLGLSDLDQPGLLRYKEKYASGAGDIVSYQARGVDPDARSAAVRALVKDMTAELVASSATTDELTSASSMLYRFFC
jgi:hypothetical protein